MTKDQRMKQVNTINIILAQAEKAIYDATSIRMRVIVTHDLPHTPDVGPWRILEVIAAALNMLPTDYAVKSKQRMYKDLKWLGITFLREYFPAMSLKDMAEYVKYEDHTSAIHALNQTKITLGLKDTYSRAFAEKYQIVLEALTQVMADKIEG